MPSTRQAPWRRAPWCVLAIKGAVACLPQPTSATKDSVAAQTQVPVGSLVPGPGSDSTGAGTNGVVAGSGTVGINANGTVPAVPKLSGVQLTLSLSSASAPDLCLSLADSVSPQSALVLRTCSTNALQRWVLVNGVLQSSQGTCVTYDPSNDAAVMQPCDSNNMYQQLLTVGGQLVLPKVTPVQVVLQVAQAPATTASVINFRPYDVNVAALQAWSFGQFTHDSNQVLERHGVSMQVLEAGATCLSGSASGPTYAPCAGADSNQAWIVTSAGLVQNEASSQCLGVGQGRVQMVACETGPAAFWGVQAGLLYAADSSCLDVDPNVPGGSVPALLLCDFAKSRHFVFGLSKKP